LFNEKKLNLFIFLFPNLITPTGVPHELHTNLPDNARSALILELPQTRHLVAIIWLNQFKISSRNDNGVVILLA